MTLTKLELDTISTAAKAAKMIIEDLKPILDRVDVIYNAATIGVGSSVTQDGLNAVPSYSGLTKSQLDDGVYALTATLKGAIESAYPALTQLGLRY